MTRRLVLGAGAAVVALAVGLGLAALLGAFDSSGDPRARAAAQQYAEALTEGSSRDLAAITCDPPTRRQAKAFDIRAGAGAMRWSVLEGPNIEDDIAHVTLRAADGDRHRDFAFTLHRRGDSWCAYFNWSRLDAGR